MTNSCNTAFWYIKLLSRLPKLHSLLCDTCFMMQTVTTNMLMLDDNMLRRLFKVPEASVVCTLIDGV